MQAGGLVGYTIYNVPVGRRAVITNVDVANAGGVTGQVKVGVRQQDIWSHVVQASEPSVNETFRVPVYGGEQLYVYTGHTTIGATLSGYLFDDTAGRARAPEVFESEVLPPDRDLVTELPA